MCGSGQAALELLWRKDGWPPRARGPGAFALRGLMALHGTLDQSGQEVSEAGTCLPHRGVPGAAAPTGLPADRPHPDLGGPPGADRPLPSQQGREGGARVPGSARGQAPHAPKRCPYSRSRLAAQGVRGARPCLEGPEERRRGFRSCLDGRRLQDLMPQRPQKALVHVQARHRPPTVTATECARGPGTVSPPRTLATTGGSHCCSRVPLPGVELRPGVVRQLPEVQLAGGVRGGAPSRLVGSPMPPNHCPAPPKAHHSHRQGAFSLLGVSEDRPSACWEGNGVPRLQRQGVVLTPGPVRVSSFKN